jgi:alpha-methylacyl-CoA racemase
VTGVLDGLRVVEFGSIGPGPFCAMMLADHGADVVRIERPGAGSGISTADPEYELLHRNRRTIELDLKNEVDRDAASDLVARADVVIEGNRPGVMERLGLGPEVCRERNPALVYGRMTGWGQDGPYAGLVGHDVNYLSISGTLSLIGGRETGPTIPLALLGDFAGGGMMLAFGIMAALWERTQSGEGQVIDAAILDGATLLATAFHGFRQGGVWSSRREDNLVDGGAPFYSVYETSDGEWISVGALEPRFYEQLLRVFGLQDSALPDQYDHASWPGMKARFAAIVATRSRDDWVAAAVGTDACLTPVLSLEEARADAQVSARGTIPLRDGLYQPAPAPRFSRTVADLRTPPAAASEVAETVEDILGGWSAHSTNSHRTQKEES